MQITYSRPLKERNAATPNTMKRIRKYWVLYPLILIPLAIIFIYNYIPMVGVILAFKDYKVTLGFAGIFTSPSVGLDNFKSIFAGPSFFRAVRNTFIISALKLIFTFPGPILFALMLNEVKNIAFKRSVQTISYLPNFLSMVIIYGIVLAVISPNYGLLNMLRQALGMDAVNYLANERYFRSILVIIDVWAGTGWGAIIYLAAMSGINEELYEAATIDGATRIQKMRHITLPSITGIIVFLLVLQCGGLLSVSFEQVFLLYSPTVYSVGDVIGTYTYRKGLVYLEYGYSTAVGLFNSVVSFALVFISNFISHKLGYQGVW